MDVLGPTKLKHPRITCFFAFLLLPGGLFWGLLSFIGFALEPDAVLYHTLEGLMAVISITIGIYYMIKSQLPAKNEDINVDPEPLPDVKEGWDEVKDK